MAGKPESRRQIALIENLGIDAIADRVAGGETIRSIAADLGVNPNRISSWVNSSDERAAALSRARMRGAHALVEEGHSIVMQATNESATVAKLQSDYLKWMAAKFNAAAYGENRAPVVAINIDSQAWHAIKHADALTIDAPQQD
jgi:transposase-like protein